MAELPFDAAGVDPRSQFETLPAGDYVCIITESQMKPTKDGRGNYLELTLEVQSGEFYGRKLFDRLNLQNTSAKTVEIAQRALSQICHATGVMQITDSQQLHFKPLVATVRIEKDEKYGDRNAIRGYKAAGNGALAATAPTAPTPAASAPAAPARPRAPWQKEAA